MLRTGFLYRNMYVLSNSNDKTDLENNDAQSSNAESTTFEDCGAIDRITRTRP